ncbi:hypothetical protein [Sporomusa malonica]|uniref:hypothetical protein n=1 Tax=Sporomusa malonica TaxID=112901 RepID=UPI00352AF156
MKKLTFLMAITFVLVTLSGTALAWSDRSEGHPDQYNSTQKWNHFSDLSEDHPFFRFARLNGKPGLYVWSDRNDEQLHIRAVNKNSWGNQHVYSGVIQTDGKFYNIEEKQLENGDYVKLDRERNTIRFRFTGRGMDGIDFKVRGGDTVDFDLYKDGKEMPTKEICIGKKSWHPWHNNFYFER